jgi:hypothetical protein
MAAEKLLFPRRWYGGMISTHLEVIWEIPAYRAFPKTELVFPTNRVLA